jgi:hypothetical protein
MPDFDRSRRVWHGHIASWGGGENNGFLVRDGARRSATMAISAYTPRERGLYADGVVRIMISALNVPVSGVPDPELDTVEFKGKRYKLTLPPQNPQPDGTWIAFDCPCLFIGDA